MSWNITHQCRFQSRTGQQYCVNISKQTDTGQNIVQLQGSEHPFVTSEANGDDIFMPIRQQTGYLRVLDNSGGTLIDELLPENNTQKMVTLVNLTTGKTEWIGFLAAEVFTQPWDKETTELEFPLKSALACLSDVTIQTGVTGTNRLALLVYSAITSLFGEGNVPFTEIVLMDDFKNVCDELLIRVNFETFFSKETIKNDNTKVITRVGTSYREAITAMCEVFGLTLRQQGTLLIFGRYDNGGNFNINVNVMDWSILAMIANKTDAWPYDNLQPQGTIITRDLLPIADFRGNNNKLSFVPGGKAAIVSLSVDDADGDNIITMPQAAIIEGGVRQAVMANNGEYVEGSEWDDPDNPFYVFRLLPFRWKDGTSVYNFQHVPRGNSDTETFEYRNVHVDLTSGSSTDIARTHTLQSTYYDVGTVLYASMFGYWGNYYRYNQSSIYTGAIPGRWGKGQNVLENCLLLVQDVNTSFDTLTDTAIAYYIRTTGNEEMHANSYLNIQFDVPLTVFSVVNGLTRHNRWVEPEGTATYSLTTVGGTVDLPNGAGVLGTIVYSMECILRLETSEGDYYWDGYEWYLNTWKNFWIGINGTSIMPSGAELPIDNVSGYLAKVTSTIVGKVGRVAFAFLNKVDINNYYRMEIKDPSQYFSQNEIYVYAYPFQKIITGLEINVVYERPVTVGDNNNVYRKTIIDSGFSENKQIDLTLGTNNSNNPSPSLLRSYGNEGYIVDIGYIASDGSMVAERPEMHLLNRMVEYYKTMRRTMEAKIATGIDLFRNRFSYNGRKYMAIDKKHDWEREEQEVKFIEVT